MAQPIVPIEIWAEQDILLPNTHKDNKVRPIDDLWAKGWDWGEAPDCEAINYLLNMTTIWLDYISNEQIPGQAGNYLLKDNNLSDVPDKNAARNNLDVYSKTEADTRYVNITGDTMTGDLTLPTLRFTNTQPDDIAYITTTSPSNDVTYLDIVVGDNPNLNGQAVDKLRFRFDPTGSTGQPPFTMMEFNAIDTKTAWGVLTGKLTVTEDIFCNTLNATQTNSTNANITNTLTANTVNATTITTSTINATTKVTTPQLGVSGTTTTSSLTVTNNNATVGGKNIVRSVNGINADANGNVTVPLPSAGVTNMRYTGKQAYQERNGNERLPGGLMTTWSDFGSSNYWIYVRQLQYQINGSWVTVAY